MTRRPDPEWNGAALRAKIHQGRRECGHAYRRTPARKTAIARSVPPTASSAVRSDRRKSEQKIAFQGFCIASAGDIEGLPFAECRQVVLRTRSLPLARLSSRGSFLSAPRS
jgi:hypothetical protein